MRQIILYIFITFSSISVFSQNSAFPLHASQNGRYLVDSKNKPFFYQAETPWLIFVNLNEKKMGELMPGNDDGGEMSAWYVFSSLGFYPVNPAEARYVIGIPLFEEAVIQLPENKTFTIKAKNLNAENRFIQSVRLNGNPWKSIFIDHKDLVSGGLLDFEMDEKPVNCFQ